MIHLTSKLKGYFLLLAFAISIATNSTAQTAGSGTLSSIEAKADMIAKNNEKVAELRRQHFETYNLESEKLKNLKRELSSLIAEKEAVLDEYRRGQFCTGCNVPRSQFAPGETFPHSGQSVRAATPEELAAKAKYYDDKIDAKSKEAKEFEFSENEFTRKRADIDKQVQNLTDQTEKLKAEIIELSKTYKEKVVAEGKSITKPWIDNLMRIIAEKHVIEDKIDILNVKIADLENEEAEVTANMKEKVRKQNEKDIDDLRNKIAAKRSQLQSLEDLYWQRNRALNETLNQQRQRLNEVKKLLEKPEKLKTDELDRLTQEQSDLTNRIDATEKEIADLKANYEKDSEKTKTEIKQADDKIWDLTVNLSKRQEDALVALREAFKTKLKIL